MGAEGSQASISIREEVTWGVLDAGQFTGTNFVSEDLAYKKIKQASNNVRPDRQTVNLVTVGAEALGGIVTEFQADNLDLILPGALWAEVWVSTPTLSNPVQAAIESSGGVGGKFTFHASDTIDLIAGQFITITAMTETANNGTFLIIDVTGKVVQVASPLATEVDGAGVLNSDRIINGVFSHSYSLERANHDISQFFLYTGLVPNILDMEYEHGNPVMFNVTFVGKEEQLAQVQWGTTDPTDLSVNQIFSASSDVAQVLVDGVVLGSCLLQKFSFQLDNQVVGKTGVGTIGFCDAKAKSLKLTGAISLYFTDETYYEKYINATTFDLAVSMVDDDGNAYGVYLAKCEFDDATANVTGRDDDVMVEGTFIGLMGTDEGYTICLSRAV